MRRAFLGVGVYMLFSIAGTVRSDLVPYLVSGAGQCQYPAADDSIVVWQEGANNPDIYGYSFSQSSPITVCIESGDQRYPDISGDIIVWQDDRSGSKDIYGFNLSMQQELNICDESGDQSYPSVDGNIVVWQDKRNGNWDIYGYNLATSQEIIICTQSSHQYYPVVSDNRVVWVDSRNGNYDIYGYDLNTQQELEICLNTFGQTRPHIHGDLVVWQDLRNSATTGYDLYGYDLAGGNEFEVCVHSQDQTYPAVHGEYVIWLDRRDGGDYDLYYKNLANNDIRPIIRDGEEQKNPTLTDQRFIWQSSDDSIYAADMPEDVQLILDYPNGDQGILAGTVLPIQWHTSGSMLHFIDIEYSADSGQNWHLLQTQSENDGLYQWSTPGGLDSEHCLIRITDSQDPSLQDQSGNEFAIFQCDLQLTADLTGDCKVDMEDFMELTSQWLQCGNPYDPMWCE